MGPKNFWKIIHRENVTQEDLLKVKLFIDPIHKDLKAKEKCNTPKETDFEKN